MIKTLIVKCPHCGGENDLGERAVEVYNSSFAFQLDRKCGLCGEWFGESDTSEADYAIKDYHTIAPVEKPV